jgi:hypothetical protein
LDSDYLISYNSDFPVVSKISSSDRYVCKGCTSDASEPAEACLIPHDTPDTKHCTEPLSGHSRVRCSELSVFRLSDCQEGVADAASIWKKGGMGLIMFIFPHKEADLFREGVSTGRGGEGPGNRTSFPIILPYQ